MPLRVLASGPKPCEAMNIKAAFLFFLLRGLRVLRYFLVFQRLPLMLQPRSSLGNPEDLSKFNETIQKLTEITTGMLHQI